MITHLKVLHDKPDLVAELNSNKKFKVLFSRLECGLREVPKLLYSSEVVGRVIQLVYDDNIKQIRRLEQDFVSRGKQRAFNQAISTMRRMFFDSREKVIELRKADPKINPWKMTSA